MLKTCGTVVSAFPARSRTTKFVSLASFSNTFTNASPPVRRNATLIELLQQSPSSAYIHLPFCRKRCHYCDFPIVALGSTSSNQIDDDPRVFNYVQLICQEIRAINVDFDHNPPLETVFFGGGTPSLVPPKLVQLILDVLRGKFGICTAAEISMEMDPGTFDVNKLEELMELGVNRVSLGVQAFQDELLKACGRAHGVKEVYEAIEIVHSCGVENWSMDLISSLPHQTQQMWEESLRLTIDAQPKHVSVYDLQVEQGTKFGVLYTPGEFPLPSDSQSANFYGTTTRLLSEACFKHYEISSYCKDSYECKHNSTYWKNKPFYAFGLGSASYVKGLRFSRPRKMKEYITFVESLQNGVVKWCGDGSDVDVKELATDVVMLSLRTANGLDLRSFKENFGGSLAQSICRVYKPYVESGHVICLDKERRVLSVDKSSTLLSSDDDAVENGVKKMMDCYEVDAKFSCQESLRIIIADIHYANMLAAAIPVAKNGTFVQMKPVYNQLTPIIMCFLEWIDCSCTFLISHYLNLFHIAIYEVCPKGKTTSCIRKATIKEFYGVILPYLRRLRVDSTEIDTTYQQHCYSLEKVVVIRKKLEDRKTFFSEVDLEREDECGICFEPCTKVVLPICCHAMCINCFHDWRMRSVSCPFCRGSLKRVNSGDLWVLTCSNDVVDSQRAVKDDVTQFYLYINSLPKDIPDALFLVYYDYLI